MKPITRPPVLALVLACVNLIAGCGTTDHLSFPRQPLRRDATGIYYDTDGDGKADFALLDDGHGRPRVLAYDDREDGSFNRRYRLDDYATADVPHLVILLDSIPYQGVVERYAAGDFAWFDPPRKVIPPFPSLTEQVFTRILQSPPLPGMIDDYYDPRLKESNSGILQRVNGYHQPWEYRCNYVAKYYEGGLSYVQPRPWYRIELGRAKRAFEQTNDRVTIVYLTSASGMLCRYGREGMKEVLDEVQRFMLQVLYERHGAVKISVLADHGHNLMRSTNVAVEPDLQKAGFTVAEKLAHDKDVVIDHDGLVTYLGLHTREPAEVAEAVLKDPAFELATYMEGERVIVRDHDGSAAIECHAGRFRYVPITKDVLGYGAVMDAMKRSNKFDADGFASDRDWFDATADHQYPDAPRRLWDATHGLVINPPDVMLTLHDGYCCGSNWMQKFIDMASTHGSLNQVNSATFLFSMTAPHGGPLRSIDVMGEIEPDYVIPIRRPK